MVSRLQNRISASRRSGNVGANAESGSGRPTLVSPTSNSLTSLIGVSFRTCVAKRVHPCQGAVNVLQPVLLRGREDTLHVLDGVVLRQALPHQGPGQSRLAQHLVLWIGEDHRGVTPINRHPRLLVTCEWRRA